MNTKNSNPFCLKAYFNRLDVLVRIMHDKIYSNSCLYKNEHLWICYPAATYYMTQILTTTLKNVGNSCINKQLPLILSLYNYHLMVIEIYRIVLPTDGNPFLLRIFLEIVFISYDYIIPTFTGWVSCRVYSILHGIFTKLSMQWARPLTMK